MERDEFSLVYQPIVDGGGKPCALEGLLRWNWSERAEVPTSVFIAVAEDSHQIVPIGKWVLKNACEELKTWEEAQRLRLSVHVNVSAVQFTDPNFAKLALSIMSDVGIDPRRIVLEITETAILRDASQAVRAIAPLREAGVRIAIDDFGVGQTALYYLKRFSVGMVKIDGSFVAGLPGAREDAAIVKSIISLAHSLDIPVVAEGVETPEQRDFLIAQDCDYLQGYLVSRPQSRSAIDAFLRVR